MNQEIVAFHHLGLSIQLGLNANFLAEDIGLSGFQVGALEAVRARRLQRRSALDHQGAAPAQEAGRPRGPVGHVHARERAAVEGHPSSTVRGCEEIDLPPDRFSGFEDIDAGRQNEIEGE